MRREPPGAGFSSQCLGEFLQRVGRLDPHPAVLDLGVLCGDNIAFLGGRGCRVSVESLPSPRRAEAPAPLAAEHSRSRPSPPRSASGPMVGPGLRDRPAPQPGPGNRQQPAAAVQERKPAAPEQGAERAVPSPVPPVTPPLSYPPGSFSGILAWDAISRMPSREAIGFVESLRKLLDEGGVILAYFPGPPGHQGGSAGRYRIMGVDKVALEPAAERHVHSPAYQNREIYALFSRFEVIRLSHLKSGTREVLVAKSRRSARD